ncbi:MAG: hypothetical protein KAH17_10600 [Bacteroidales bacterium]|nr:hypothetical protein [Bacteroidales bacterium]
MRPIFFFLFFVLPMSLAGQSISSESIRWRLLDLQLEFGNEQIQKLNQSSAKSELISLELFLQLMTNQTESEYDRFLQESKRLAKDFRKDFGNTSFKSSLFLFRLHMYRAISSAQFEKYGVAAKDIIQSHKAYKRMLERHPAHPLTKMARGFFAVLVKQVPDRYGKFVKLAGFDEVQEDGFRLLKSAYKQSKGSDDTLVAETGLLWVLCLWEFDPNHEHAHEAWQMLDDNKQISALALTRYVGLLSGFKSGKMDIVNSILDKMEEDDQMDRLSYSYYQRGKYRLFCREAECVDDFNRFIEKAGQGNYVKSAWLRTGFYWTIIGDESRAEYCFEQVGNQGVSLYWNDSQAMNEVLGVVRPHPKLLSLRLLYDGAFYEECLKEAEQLLSANQGETDSFLAEVYYRKARSFESLHQTAKALDIYELILRDFREVKSYHIPQSALFAAEILVEQRHNQKAISYLDLGSVTNKYAYQKTFRRQIQSLRRQLEN